MIMTISRLNPIINDFSFFPSSLRLLHGRYVCESPSVPICRSPFGVNLRRPTQSSAVVICPFTEVDSIWGGGGWKNGKLCTMKILADSRQRQQRTRQPNPLSLQLLAFDSGEKCLEYKSIYEINFFSRSLDSLRHPCAFSWRTSTFGLKWGIFVWWIVSRIPSTLSINFPFRIYLLLSLHDRISIQHSMKAAQGSSVSDFECINFFITVDLLSLTFENDEKKMMTTLAHCKPSRSDF